MTFFPFLIPALEAFQSFRDAGRSHFLTLTFLLYDSPPSIHESLAVSTRFAHIKMADKLLLAFIIMDFLFVIAGGLIIGFSLMMENEMAQVPTAHTIARNLLLGRFHLTGKQYPVFRNGVIRRNTRD